jgi:hypothetical protein
MGRKKKEKEGADHATNIQETQTAAPGNQAISPASESAPADEKPEGTRSVADPLGSNTTVASDTATPLSPPDPNAPKVRRPRRPKDGSLDNAGPTPERVEQGKATARIFIDLADATVFAGPPVDPNEPSYFVGLLPPPLGPKEKTALETSFGNALATMDAGGMSNPWVIAGFTLLGIVIPRVMLMVGRKKAAEQQAIEEQQIRARLLSAKVAERRGVPREYMSTPMPTEPAGNGALVEEGYGAAPKEADSGAPSANPGP